MDAAPSWRELVGDLSDASTPIRPQPLREFPRDFSLQRNTYPVAYGITPEPALPGARDQHTIDYAGAGRRPHTTNEPCCIEAHIERHSGCAIRERRSR